MCILTSLVGRRVHATCYHKGGINPLYKPLHRLKLIVT